MSRVLSYSEAVKRSTAPGQRFSLTSVEIGGIEYRVFANAPASLPELFQVARRHHDVPFLVQDDEKWTFDATFKAVDRLAGALSGHYAIQHGDRVGIAMRNVPEWVISFIAVTSIGAIAVSLNAWWGRDELDFAITDSGVSLLIADVERSLAAQSTCKRKKIPVLVARDTKGSLTSADLWDDILDTALPSDHCVVLPDDDATILYTSGTTGRPRGAVSTHRAILQALFGFGCRAAVDRLRNPATSISCYRPVFMLATPLFHVTGMAVMLSSLIAGTELVLLHKWDPDRALQLIERERVTNFVGVPTQSADLLESRFLEECDTSSLLTIAGGGAPAAPELVKRLASRFDNGSPSIGYGLTESNAYGPQNTGIDYLNHPTSVGRATPILEVDVRNSGGQSLPTGESGELWLKGPHLIRGYWNEAASGDVLVDGWLRTGDIGHIDAEGFIYVDDRIKDMVLRAGENVYCAEVEAAIYSHAAVREVAVFGLPQPRLGEEVAAVVLPRPGHKLTADEVQLHVASQLAAYKVPSTVIIVADPLPRSASGKILKRDLRDRLCR